MSTPNANPAINTFLQMSDGGSPENFNTVANVSSINGFSMAAQVVDVTSHSNADPWRRKITTLLDGGDLVFDVFFIYNDSGHKTLLKNFVNRGLDNTQFGTVPIDFKLSIPTPGARTVVAFSAYISKFTQSFPVDNVVKAQLTLIVVGEPIFPGVND